MEKAIGAAIAARIMLGTVHDGYSPESAETLPAVETRRRRCLGLLRVTEEPNPMAFKLPFSRFPALAWGFQRCSTHDNRRVDVD